MSNTTLADLFIHYFPCAQAHQESERLQVQINGPTGFVFAFLGPFMVQVKYGGGPALFEVLALSGPVQNGHAPAWTCVLRHSSQDLHETLFWGRAWLLGQAEVLLRTCDPNHPAPLLDPDFEQDNPHWFEKISPWHLEQLLTQGFPSGELFQATRRGEDGTEHRLAVVSLGLFKPTLSTQRLGSETDFRASLKIRGMVGKAKTTSFYDADAKNNWHSQHLTPDLALDWVLTARTYLYKLGLDLLGFTQTKKDSG